MHSKEALRHLATELQASSKRILEYSRNTAATGLHRERLVESYLRRITPQAFEICSGFLYGKQQSSKQVDLIIYDHLNFAPLFDEGGYKVLLPDSVRYVVEVKSRLDKTSIDSAFDNIRSVTDINSSISGIVFAFDGLSVEKTLDHIQEYVEKMTRGPGTAFKLPRMIVNLGRWVICSKMYLEDDSALTYYQDIDAGFEDQFAFVFADIYYSLYRYRQRLHRDGALSSLEEQGFQQTFEVGINHYLHTHLSMRQPEVSAQA